MAKDTGSYPGHDEGSNGPDPNAPSTVFQGGSTFAPLAGGADGGTSVKNDLGKTGKAEGGE